MDDCSISLIDWSVAQEPIPGQTESGDRFVVKGLPGGALVAVIDGIGHGPEAAHSAELAVGVLQSSIPGSPISLLSHCQRRLQGTRGAVLSMAFFNSVDDNMTWLGVGNVTGVLLRKEARPGREQESLLLRAGVVGAQLPYVSPSVLPLTYGDTLIFATDGISGGFADKLNINASTREIAQHIVERHWRRIDDALVLVVRYVHKNQSAPQ